MDAKDLLIEKQAEEIKTFKKTITRLQEQIARLKKDSSNSSKPPSSDIVKTGKILRRLGKKRKRGGQHGHRTVVTVIRLEVLLWRWSGSKKAF